MSHPPPQWYPDPAAIAAIWFVLQLTTFNDLGDEVDRANCLVEGRQDC